MAYQYIDTNTEHMLYLDNVMCDLIFFIPWAPTKVLHTKSTGLIKDLRILKDHVPRFQKADSFNFWIYSKHKKPDKLLVLKPI